jgi:hypothetical protein
MTCLLASVLILLACSFFSLPSPVSAVPPPTLTSEPSFAASESFLNAINNNNLTAADQFVCESQRGVLVEQLMNRKSMYPKGTWIQVITTNEGGHGVTSPGLKDITCKDQPDNNQVVCTFLRPDASCTMSIRQGNVTGFNCSISRELSTEVTFTFEEGKICDYGFYEP